MFVKRPAEGVTISKFLDLVGFNGVEFVWNSGFSFDDVVVEGAGG